MRVDAGLMGGLADVPARIRELEAAGFDGAMTAETAHDPFFPLLLAAEHSQRIELITSIAVAFARSPMTLANQAHDLNAYSKGRFILGLGSQIAPHITKRFSMPWSHPAARMRELILAMRAIWATWHTGKKLEFRGEFYTHTLMTPMFTPTDTSYGPPQGVPRRGRPAHDRGRGRGRRRRDRARVHDREVPARRDLARARARSREGGPQARRLPGHVPRLRRDRREREGLGRLAPGVCKQIAFYGSTPAYRPVLEMHGWGGLQTELNALSKQGQWDKMGELVSDDVLEAFAVVGTPDEIVPKFKARFGGVVDRTTLAVTGAKAGTKELIAQLHG